MLVHLIHGDDDVKALGASSKLNAEWKFLQHLRDLGRRKAGEWLQSHFDDLGQRSTAELRPMFQG